jgi:phage gp36-like protein
MIVRPGTTSRSYNILIADRTGAITGTAGDGVTGLRAATMPALFWFRDNEDDVDFPALSDLASLDAPFVEGGVFERGGGYYRVDGPDAMLALEGMVTIDSDDADKEPIFDDIQVTGQPVPGVASASGKYVTQADMEAVRGAENIRKWSRKGGDDETTDGGAVQRAIDDAENEIDGRLRLRYLVDLVNDADGGPISVTDAATLRRWAEAVASYRVYLARGFADDDPVGNKLKAERNAVLGKDPADPYDGEIGMYLKGVLRLDARRIAVTSNAPVVVGGARLPSSSRCAIVDGYGGYCGGKRCF